ncbi:hypothetical protein ACQEVZ_20260 [Dactylosporangium sp. CA-152071]|uniref:hypothetical protein n=1 Tax=Dactylosporangium sp. CA-152071 TaxID=3239933 RepID=UPI003D89CA6E
MAENDPQNPPSDPKPPARKPPALKVKHLDGCPAKPERVEQYDTDRHNRDHSLTTFTVTRCQDCGAHEAKEKA